MKISLKNVLLIGFDVICFCVIDILYYFISRFASYSIPMDDVLQYAANSATLLLMIFAFRLLLGVYSTVWRYTSTSSYFRLILADMFGGIAAMVCSRLFGIYPGIWFFVTVAALGALAAQSARYCYRLLYKRKQCCCQAEPHAAQVRVAIVGAGQLGAFLANELRSNPKSHYRPVCFIDTDRSKIRGNVVGLQVYPEEDVPDLIAAQNISDVIIAISRLSSDEMEKLYHQYENYGCQVKIYDSPIRDGMSMDDGSEKRRVVREFQIEDLLFRKPLSITDWESLEFYRNQVVLVTGGGGSIGSELCRQIAKCRPKQLIILDIYENNAYDIQQELLSQYGDELNLSVVIGSVRDRQRLDCVFRTYRPDIVFHAAAHKHVPLMEDSGSEAVKNNVLGTYNTADMAEKYGAGKFILISTDKAVNPTNIMGASKRMCEMIVQCRTDSKTSFAAVRFGNVLGSNGSVIPLFKKQIAAGGPVTITDKRIIRYFMTIPEASQLVMQAGAMAKRGELFVLDMGNPVQIYELAKNMIKLSGFTPEVDIQIKEVGLRPGEKLYEELLMKSETMSTTPNKMIFIEKDTPLSRSQIEQKLVLLKQAIADDERNGNAEAIKAAFKLTVSTYCDPETVNGKVNPSEGQGLAIV